MIVVIRAFALTTDLASYLHKFLPMAEPAGLVTAAMVDEGGANPQAVVADSRPTGHMYSGGGGAMGFQHQMRANFSWRLEPS